MHPTTATLAAAAVAGMIGAATLPTSAMAQSNPASAAPRFTLAVHGGSGTITRKTITPEVEAAYRASLERALLAGHKVLAAGGSAKDAVVATIQVFEDDPLFNAGKGAVFTAEGRNELDASVMDGRTGQAGAVAGVTTIKNPITAARAVMDRSRHVLLSGAGADKFAAEQKLAIVDPSYFHTPHRWEQLQKAREAGRLLLDHDGKPRSQAPSGVTVADASATQSEAHEPWTIDHKYGTVGAVALDQQGNLAAGTSTGGLTNKLYGRIGDSPIIGAGTYADNATVAVSCTGSGEFFMRGLVAYDVAARMRYAKANVSDAVDQTIAQALTARQGRGGLIALTAGGEVKFGFNTEGMYRGVIRADGKAVTQIYAD